MKLLLKRFPWLSILDTPPVHPHNILCLSQPLHSSHWAALVLFFYFPARCRLCEDKDYICPFHYCIIERTVGNQVLKDRMNGGIKRGSIYWFWPCSLLIWQCYLEPYSYEEVATIPRKDRDLRVERKTAGSHIWSKTTLLLSGIFRQCLDT